MMGPNLGHEEGEGPPGSKMCHTTWPVHQAIQDHLPTHPSLSVHALGEECIWGVAGCHC